MAWLAPRADKLHRPASLAALDGEVRRLLAEYCGDGEVDWQRYVHWSGEHYLRNLVETEARAAMMRHAVLGPLRFCAVRCVLCVLCAVCSAPQPASHCFSQAGLAELIVITWAPGQVSRVHSHEISHCWMTCLSGSVEELRYRVAEGEDVELTSPKSPHASPPPIPGVLSSVRPCPRLEVQGVTCLSPGQTAYVSDELGLHAVRCTAGAKEGGVTLHLYAPPIRRTRLFEPDDDRVTLRQPGFYSIRGEVQSAPA